MVRRWLALLALLFGCGGETDDGTQGPPPATLSCYSPAQNLDHAYTDGVGGCACEVEDQSA
jgi:hypothetical protein